MFMFQASSVVMGDSKDAGFTFSILLNDGFFFIYVVAHPA